MMAFPAKADACAEGAHGRVGSADASWLGENANANVHSRAHPVAGCSRSRQEHTGPASDGEMVGPADFDRRPVARYAEKSRKEHNFGWPADSPNDGCRPSHTG